MESFMSHMLELLTEIPEYINNMNILRGKGGRAKLEGKEMKMGRSLLDSRINVMKTNETAERL